MENLLDRCRLLEHRVRLMRLACETLHDVARHAARHHDSSLARYTDYSLTTPSLIHITFSATDYGVFVRLMSSL